MTSTSEFLSSSPDPSPHPLPLCPPLSWSSRATVALFRALDYLVLSRLDTRITPCCDFVVSAMTRPQRVVIFAPHSVGESPPSPSLSYRGIYLHFHQGGFLGGSCMSDAVYCQYIANQAQIMVISCNYSLAPEYPYPCGLQDCFEILEWLVRTYCPSHVAVGGHSAGGTLAYGVVQLAVARNLPIACVVSFFCPMNFSSTSKHTFGVSNPYVRNIFHQAYLQNIQHDHDLNNPLLSPSYMTHIPTRASLLVIAKQDPNAQDLMLFVDKMKIQPYQQDKQDQQDQQDPPQPSQQAQQPQPPQPPQPPRSSVAHYYRWYENEFHGWCNLPNWFLRWCFPRLYTSKWEAYLAAATCIKQAFQTSA